MGRKLILFVFTIILQSPSLYPGIHYINSAADGNMNGSDWNNAWNRLPDELIRGDTYFIADGSYPPYNFNDEEMGTDSIWILKATVSSHGTDVGWQNSYGDGVAEFTTAGSINSIITFSTNNWVFNGQVGQDTSGHGFKISYSNRSENVARLISFTSHPRNILISHVEMAHAGNNNDNGHDCVYTLGCDNVTIQYCWLHDMGRVPFLFRNSDDVIIEHCWMSRNEDTAAEHSEGISAYNNGSGPVNRFIIRYNVWQDIEGTGVIMHTDTSWQIYGNIIYWDSFIGQPGREIGGNGVIGTWNGYYCDSAKVYNNTIVNMIGDRVFNGGVGYSFGISKRGHEVYNNLWYNCANVKLTSVLHDYNYFYNAGNQSEPNIQNGEADIFIDLSNNNFKLSRGTRNGKSDLKFPYNMDPLNNIRGRDGIWDRGAYEFVGHGNGNYPATVKGIHIEKNE